jgi:hypothetical protein
MEGAANATIPAVGGWGFPEYHRVAERPPREEQQEIVRRVEALFKLADVIEKRVTAASLRAEKLTQAIFAKAFRGELVPTEAELARREGPEVWASIGVTGENKSVSRLLGH